MVARSIEASRLVVACSAFTERELVARFPDAADRIVRVSWGADEDLPAPPPRDEARRQLGVRGPYLLTVGSIFGRRRIPELIEAIGLLSLEVPGVVLDVVGENRTHPRFDLAGLVRRLGLERHVRLSGFADEAGLSSRYAAADAAVFLSEYEGFGLPPLEAACRGVPLVTSDRPSLCEIFGESALLVCPTDPRGIANTLARLLRDEPLRRSLVRRGHELAARLSWKATADTLFDALQRAARRS
jgi:glycosyltransferase involved in cell wall biosynthesis